MVWNVQTIQGKFPTFEEFILWYNETSRFASCFAPHSVGHKPEFIRLPKFFLNPAKMMTPIDDV